MKARDLITQALRKLGAIASGDVPSAEEASDALAALNLLIDSWRNERLMVYSVLPQTFSLVAGKKTYTMGPGGDFDTARPVRIEMVQLTYTQDSPQPLNLPIEIVDVDYYNRFVVPDTQSTIPMWVYIDDAFPKRTLYFYTVPSIVNQVQIYTWTLLGTIASLDTDIPFPEGYASALLYNLAIDLAPEYGIDPSATVVARATETKASVKSKNNTYAPTLMADAALIAKPAGFNYLTGE